MQRTIEDLQRAADLAGAVLLGTEEVQLRDGSWTLAGHFGFEDPWAAARLLCILAEEDASDPVVAAWAAHILEQTADENGLAPDDPELADLFAEAVHANVKRFVRFAPEEGERFQSARTTMIEGVGDCDCHARLEHALVRSQGLPSQIVFFEDDGEPVHAVDTIGTTDGMQWAETTIDADFGEHPQEAYARLGLDTRPDIGGVADIGGTWGFVTPSDVASRKTELDASVKATDADVAQCTTLDQGTRGAWTAFVKAWGTFMADEPGWFSSGAQGRQASEYADELRQWQERLAPRCTLSAPVVPDEGGLTPIVKIVAVAVSVVAGAVVAGKVADVVIASRRARAARA
jgi:hypothetical protein